MLTSRRTDLAARGVPEPRGRRWRLSWCLALAAAVSACSGGAQSPADAADATCQDIRACIAQVCGDGDQACVQRCISRGTTAAKAAFQGLATCTAGQCPTATMQCTCEQQCYAEGLCLAETEACVGAVTDIVCDELCH
ncbi:MAG: hypothetical protein ABUS79_01190 [Pseudomonadota bacterium]